MPSTTTGKKPPVGAKAVVVEPESLALLATPTEALPATIDSPPHQRPKRPGAYWEELKDRLRGEGRLVEQRDPDVIVALGDAGDLYRLTYEAALNGAPAERVRVAEPEGAEDLLGWARGLVHVYPPRLSLRDLYTIEPATVGWATPGGQTPQAARVMAWVLGEAADEADRQTEAAEAEAAEARARGAFWRSPGRTEEPLQTKGKG